MSLRAEESTRDQSHEHGGQETASQPPTELLATSTNENDIHRSGSNNTLTSIAVVLGLDQQSDLNYLKHVFNFSGTTKGKAHRPDSLSKTGGELSSPERHRTLCLNSLRLDRNCMAYLTKQFQSVDPKDRSKSLFLCKSIINIDDCLALEQVFSDFVSILSEATLKQIRIWDREDAQKLHPNQVVALFRSIRHAMQTEKLYLNALNLQGNDDLGLAAKEMLLRIGSHAENDGLAYLSFDRCIFDHDVAQSICSALPSLTNLSHVSILNCDLDDAMQQTLVNALVACHATGITLQQCFHGPSSLPFVTHLLKEKKNLTFLDLSNNMGLFSNHCQEEHVQEFATALATTSSLRTLNLRFCRPMCQSVVLSLFRALERNPHPHVVTELDLRGCGFGTFLDWSKSLSFITSLHTLHLPHDLRSPQTNSSLLAALRTYNTSLCSITGEGRWRRSGCRVQRLLLRNQWLAVVRQMQQPGPPTVNLWPLVLSRLGSNNNPFIMASGSPKTNRSSNNHGSHALARMSHNSKTTNKTPTSREEHSVVANSLDRNPVYAFLRTYCAESLLVSRNHFS